MRSGLKTSPKAKRPDGASHPHQNVSFPKKYLKYPEGKLWAC
jgi:hypothetical protein